jgi:hypothetical protein
MQRSRALTGPGHAVQFYENDTYLRGVVVSFLADGVRGGHPAVAIATGAHCKAFSAGLDAKGFPVDALVRDGKLRFLDAAAVLDEILVDGMPDPVLFRTKVGDVVERAGGRTRVVRAYGEMVDVLWARGNPNAALRLEELWNALAGEFKFALLCGYDLAHFLTPDQAAAFENVCAQHHHVVPTDPIGQLI